jgi:hypothetical protein
MDLWEMTGLSPRQTIALFASGLVMAAVLAVRAWVRGAREEEERGLRLHDR